MALAGGVVAAVAAVSLAIVHEFDADRRKRRVEPAEHFNRYGTGVRSVHCPYIGRFDGNASVQIARPGGGGEGALRGPRMPRARRVQGAAGAVRFRWPGELAVPVPRTRPRAQREV